MHEIEKALSPVFFVGNIFGILLIQDHPKEIFKQIKDYNRKSTLEWTYLKIIYTIYYLIGVSLCVILYLVTAFPFKFNVAEISWFVYYGWSTAYAINYMSISANWKRIMRKWCFLEEDLFKMSGKTYTLKFTSRMILCVVMVLSFVEYVISITDVLFEHRELLDFENFMKINFYHIFDSVQYSHLAGVYFLVTDFVLYSIIEFTDIFIMVTALGIAAAFQQITKTLEMKIDTNVEYYKKIRELYNRIYILHSVIEENFSPLVFFSVFGNTYYICVKLYGTLVLDFTTFEAFRYVYGLLFNILKMMLLCICCAKIYEESKRPLQVLFAIPFEYVNPEIRRLIAQISSSEIGFSGMGYFFIRRSFILAISGTVLTIELVLLQFRTDLKEVSKNSTTENFSM